MYINLLILKSAKTLQFSCLIRGGKPVRENRFETGSKENRFEDGTGFVNRFEDETGLVNRFEDGTGLVNMKN
ncbi:hypothetical protein BpHYR1_005532 [Brachionus plicatilis]|uniref:Uncharacterized protein n=1 Tax=Brachionus plicatilis TaxID=10195 RepID=A0A3M7Q929_BRAPC|nr:hypothetical protein BpHYR1_005532 [Brachionus plicatilis]